MVKMLNQAETKHLESLCIRQAEIMDQLGLSKEELDLAVQNPNYSVIAGLAFADGVSWHAAQYELMGRQESEEAESVPEKPRVSLVNYARRDYGAFSRERRLVRKLGG